MFLPGTNQVPIPSTYTGIMVMVMPKPAYQNTTSEAFWDIPIYAEHNEVRANRIDALLVSHERKEVCTII